LIDAKRLSNGKIIATNDHYWGPGNGRRFGVMRLRLYTFYAGVAEPQSQEQAIGRAVVSPNPVPAGAAAGLQYELPEEADIRVALYDIQGRELAQLQSGHRTAGKHEDEITMPSGLAAGMYFVAIATDTGKMVSVKVIIE
jgi:hypothetical protein